MDTQTNIINTDRKVSWLDLIPKLIAVLAPLGIVLFFLFKLYDLINDNNDKLKSMQEELSNVRKELSNKTDKHEFKDLDEKVSRQYSIFNDRMLRDVDPMKTWIEYHKGYLDGSKINNAR